MLAHRTNCQKKSKPLSTYLSWNIAKVASPRSLMLKTKHKKQNSPFPTWSTRRILNGKLEYRLRQFLPSIEDLVTCIAKRERIACCYHVSLLHFARLKLLPSSVTPAYLLFATSTVTSPPPIIACTCSYTTHHFRYAPHGYLKEYQRSSSLRCRK